MSKLTLYGIPNCDKVRTARKWLAAQELDYTFFDLRQDSLTPEQVKAWLSCADLKTLINTRSITWRQLDDATREKLLAGDLQTIVAHPTVLKRPILQTENGCLVGFDPTQWQKETRHLRKPLSDLRGARDGGRCKARAAGHGGAMVKASNDARCRHPAATRRDRALLPQGCVEVP